VTDATGETFYIYNSQHAWVACTRKHRIWTNHARQAVAMFLRLEAWGLTFASGSVRPRAGAQMRWGPRVKPSVPQAGETGAAPGAAWLELDPQIHVAVLRKDPGGGSGSGSGGGARNGRGV